jgi:hypothetical protein
MTERKIIKAENTQKKGVEAIEQKGVSLDSQARLAEILNDSPRLVSLNGTEWEVRALRMGSQWLICQEAIKICKANEQTFGDIIRQFAVNIPSVVKVLVIALLNDKNKIFKDGNERNELSDLFKNTYDTLMWECDTSHFGNILLEVLQLVDIDFFEASHRILDIFRETTMTRKNQTLEQK